MALLDSVEFAKGDLYIIVNSKSPLAKKESIFLKEVRDEYIVYRNSSDNFQKYTDALCREAGFTPTMKKFYDFTTHFIAAS